jgi:hypothetical protein
MAMRNNHRNMPAIEALEGRRLMSTSVFLGIDCLPHGAPPTPTPGPTGSNENGDSVGETPSAPSSAPAFPPIEAVIPQVTGAWEGSQVRTDHSLGAELSLVVTTPAPGELNARLDLRGPRRIRWSGQLLYNEATGHLSMFYMSSSLVAHLDASLVMDGQTPTLEGTFGYVTPDGTYTATLTLRLVA